MCNSNTIVSLVFEEMAEEENLFATRHSSLFVEFSPVIDVAQVRILEGIILSRAERIHCSPFLLREAFFNAYQIEALSDLPRQHFDDAVLYLTQFRGAN